MPTWRPIDDLPGDWPEIAMPELRNLAAIWQEQAHRLATAEALREFNARLARQWAIETGIIENIYSIDRGTTQLLIEKGIHENLIAHGTTDKPASEIVAVLNDHLHVLTGIFDFVVGTRALSTSYIKELHQAFTQHQPTTKGIDGLGRSVEVQLQRGDWKRWPNNPSRRNGTIHEYAPPEQVASEMDRLIEWHLAHTDQGVPPEVESAWLHHRFVQIHPFQDGNGRVARTLASLVFLRGGWFPLTIDRDNRSRYIDCLERADSGDLQPLVTLFGELQRERFIQALGISESVLREQRSVQQLVQAIGERMREPHEADAAMLQSTTQIAHEIESECHTTFTTTAQQLNEMFKADRLNFRAGADRHTTETSFWFHRQIIDVANELGIFVNPSYRGWVRLKINQTNGLRANCVMAVHAVGVRFVGVCSATAFIEFRGQTADETTDIGPAGRLCRDPFTFTYRDSPANALERFSPWLNDVLVAGLERFRREV